LSGTKNNVFGIQTGVAISFFIRLKKKTRFRILYARRPEFDTAEDKLTFLSTGKLSSIAFEQLAPDEKFNWLNVSDDDFSKHLLAASSASKRAKTPAETHTIFQLFSTGIMSGRDDWVYDLKRAHLDAKMAFFSSRFHSVQRYSSHEKLPQDIKWSRNIIRKIGRKIEDRLAANLPTVASFRPFVSKEIYSSELYVDELGAFKTAFRGANRAIAFLCVSSANQILKGFNIRID